MMTPMMQQYRNIKNQYQDCFLLYRLGDFYELFFEDAEKAAAILGITLTKRGDHTPMCGIPFHAADNYIKKLLDQDYKVAICEQMESPKLGQKGPVRREVVRVLTPGTLTENIDDDSNYLMTFSPALKNKVGVCICDISTGFLRVETIDICYIEHVLVKYKPKEMIIPESLKSHFKRVTSIPDSRFNLQNCENYLKKQFNTQTLDCFGIFEDIEIQAAGFLIDYLLITQKQVLQHITKIQKYDSIQYMFMNASTRQSLEIMETVSGRYEGSLVHTLNYTKTALGKRMLMDRLSNPLMNVAAICKRQDEIEFFIKHKNILDYTREHLKGFPDLERCLSRLSLKRGGPKDMRAVYIALQKSMHIFSYMKKELSELLIEIYNILGQALKDDVPVYVKDGGFIRDGFSSELDYHRHLYQNASKLIEDLENRYKQETGIPNLRIKFNSIWGYFIEITQSHVSKVSSDFILKQTLTNGSRYMSEALSKLQESILKAELESLEEEKRLFDQLLDHIISVLSLLQELSFDIARIDVAAGNAFLAIEKNYVKPCVDDSFIFDIHQGRHPALDKDFVPNDCLLEGLHIITGPNMGGKSTYLRQNALIAIMAQAGFYVPCESAHIGLIDKVMSRIGASDDISQGRSTFMVEMTEMSAILHMATQKSLVILDEVGRGTSTSDGLAIAMAVCDYLLEHNKSKILFATHYHELSSLQHPLVKFYHVSIQEWNGGIVFLHKIEEGFCDKSYGIHVAEMAGFPKEVVEKAKKFAA